MSQTTTGLLARLKAAGFSQSEIARRTGIPQPRLSRWAGGETPEAADDALKLKALVDALPLIGADGAPPEPDAQPEAA